MRIGERGTRVAVASSCLLAVLVFLSSAALGEALCSDSFDNAGSGWDVCEFRGVRVPGASSGDTVPNSREGGRSP